MTRLHILLYDGFDELDAVGPFEVLRRAAEDADLTVRLVSGSDALDVEASYGLRVRADTRIDSAPLPDVLLVPGGGWKDRSTPGAWTEYQRSVVPDLVAQVHQSGGVVASVCTGALLLAKAGILAGRPAATHHTARGDLRAHDVAVSDARVVDDGDVVTAGGVTAGLDLAFHLVERLATRDLATTIATEMEYRRPETE